MKISYTGRPEVIPPRQRAKLEAKLQKIAKVVEHRGEKAAHVVLTHERFLHKVEITMHAWDHALVGIASDGDIAVAAHEAFDKLEKQLLKLRAKWRDTKRVRDKEGDGIRGSAALELVAPAAKKGRTAKPPSGGKNSGQGAKVSPKRVFRVHPADGSKPMTVEEAMLEMESSQDYLVYRDAKTDRTTVLMRRPDGHFDLIES